MTLRTLLYATTFAATGAMAAAEPSSFGCSGLEVNKELPSIEGKDGVFYRVNVDLRMNHPFSDAVVAQIAELSNALAEQGTTLIYVPIPTKGVTMPEYLPASAALYGFDLGVATWVHRDIQDRLTAAGVLTVDLRAAMRGDGGVGNAELPFFKSDFHWSSHGAAKAAEAIAAVIKAHPGYADLEKTEYASTETGVETAFSGMRRILQKHCRDTLPEADTMTYDTALADLTDIFGTDDAGEAEGEGGGLDIFGAEESVLPVALLGTSFSDSPINNFPGFLAEYSGVEVINYAITGGNQFGALISYMTAPEFQETRPRFLIWENPIYNNLAQYGDQPFGELVAAARNDCPIPLEATLSDDGKTLRAELTAPGQTLFLDTDGSTTLEARFRFVSADGHTRTKTILRGERLRRTGRFYMPMTGLWPAGATAVEVELNRPFGPNPILQLCDPTREDKS